MVPRAKPDSFFRYLYVNKLIYLGMHKYNRLLTYEKKYVAICC